MLLMEVINIYELGETRSSTPVNWIRLGNGSLHGLATDDEGNEYKICLTRADTKGIKNPNYRNAIIYDIGFGVPQKDGTVSTELTSLQKGSKVISIVVNETFDKLFTVDKENVLAITFTVEIILTDTNNVDARVGKRLRVYSNYVDLIGKQHGYTYISNPITNDSTRISRVVSKQPIPQTDIAYFANMIGKHF